jgi:hypothetical protein
MPADSQGPRERQAEIENFFQSQRRSYIPRWFFEIISLGFLGFFLFEYSKVAQALHLNSVWFPWALVWMSVVLVMVSLLWGGFAHVILGPE